MDVRLRNNKLELVERAASMTVCHVCTVVVAQKTWEAALEHGLVIDEKDERVIAAFDGGELVKAGLPQFEGYEGQVVLLVEVDWPVAEGQTLLVWLKDL